MVLGEELDKGFEKIEKQLKDGYCIILADLEVLNRIEEFFYQTGYVTIIPSFITFALTPKTKELQEFMGIDDNKEWKNIICFTQADYDGFVLGFHSASIVNGLGKSWSIRQLINSIFSTAINYDKVLMKGIEFNWGHFILRYVYSEEYQEHLKKRTKNKKRRKRTHIPRGMRHEVFKRDNYTCVECGAKKDDGATLHVDHIIPVSRGGTDELSNLQTLCSDCNLNKSNMITRKRKGRHII